MRPRDPRRAKAPAPGPAPALAPALAQAPTPALAPALAPWLCLCLALGLSLTLACEKGSAPPPERLKGAYSADIPALGPYARKVELELRLPSEAALSLSTAEGQLHSYRTGTWEYGRGMDVVVTLYTKSLAVATAPPQGLAKEAKEARPPDEVLVFRAENGGLKAVDYDKARWNGAELTLSREAEADHP